MTKFVKETIAISIIIVVIVLLINSPSVLADIFVAIFKTIWPIVNGIQAFVVEVFERIV